jgi:hypothetical protein
MLSLLLLPLLLSLLSLLLLQTKDTLTIKASSFGSKCELTPQLMDKVAKCGVMDNILSFAAFKSQKQLTKSDGAKRSRLTGISPSDLLMLSSTCRVAQLGLLLLTMFQVHRQAVSCHAPVEQQLPSLPIALPVTIHTVSNDASSSTRLPFSCAITACVLCRCDQAV